jgi:ABC-2 type transport system ATP-binding protein
VLLHDPKVLLLDEPASGLDPRARIEIRGLLKELRKLGKTIMVSSHILPELADICNKVGIIERGVLEFNGTVTDLMKQIRQRTILNVVVLGDPEPAARLLEQSPIVEKVELADGKIAVTLAENVTDYSDLPTALIDAGFKLKQFKEDEINLETAFMALTKGITA